MGLFGGTKVYVSSISQNLAGDYTKIPNYLKHLVLGNIIATDSPKSMGDLIQSGYGNGPGINLRRFFYWASLPGNYSSVGMPASSLHNIVEDRVDEAVTEYFGTGVGSGWIPHIVYSDIGPFDPRWFAFGYLNEFGYNASLGFTSDYSAATGKVTIVYNGVTSTVDLSSFPKGATYVYAYVIFRADPDFPHPAGETRPRPRTLLYQLGTGIASLDVLVGINPIALHEFYPPIPLRINNVSISDPSYSSLYAQASSAYKRAFSQDITKSLKSLESNKNIDDIDYAYVFFAVSADSKDNSCLQYLYNFFDYLRFYQTSTSDDQASFLTEYNAYKTQITAWTTWDSGGRVGPEPVVSPVPKSLLTSFRVGNDPLTNATYLFELTWRDISETFGSGLLKPDAKVGDVWFSTGTEALLPAIGAIGSDGTTNTILASPRTFQAAGTTLNWQVSATEWRSLTLTGMVHRNFIYQGNYVEVTLESALSDPEESGFLVPLHKPTCDTMGLVTFTQMTNACAYLVVNCYKVVKPGLLGTLLSIFFVVALVITIVIAPELAPGLLGTNASVGAALGVSAALAASVGALINAIAAMILMKIIQKVSVAVFGEKLGEIIGAVVGFVAISVGSGLSAGQSLSTIWGNMMSASSLMQLTSAVGGGISGYVQGALHELSQQMQDFKTQNDEQLTQVQELYAKNIGYGNAMFDPLSLTDTHFGNYNETPKQFLTRTLMTGSDIADISMNMIGKFTDATLTTDLPLNA